MEITQEMRNQRSKSLAEKEFDDLIITRDRARGDAEDWFQEAMRKMRPYREAQRQLESLCVEVNGSHWFMEDMGECTNCGKVS